MLTKASGLGSLVPSQFGQLLGYWASGRVGLRVRISGDVSKYMDPGVYIGAVGTVSWIIVVTGIVSAFLKKTIRRGQLVLRLPSPAEDLRFGEEVSSIIV